MVEWIIAGILFLILVFLIYCSRLLKYTIEMKKVIFEWEHGKAESFAPERSENLTLTYEDARWEYLFRLEVKKNKQKEPYEKAKAAKYEAAEKKEMAQQKIEHAAEQKRKQEIDHRAEHKQEQIRNVRKFLSRIIGVISRRKD